MTASVQQMLKTFEGLSDIEKRELASEVLRRSIQWDWPPLTDDALIQNAEQLFLELDQQEAE